MKEKKKKKETGVQISKIRNERREVTTDTTEIQMILRDCYEQLYTNKTDNLEDIDKFLETYNLPSLNQGGIETMNILVTRNENKSV